jgi:hypothetical protein
MPESMSRHLLGRAAGVAATLLVSQSITAVPILPGTTTGTRWTGAS